MKKIINKIKNNKLFYVIVGILIGLAITAGGVYAATVINASSVAFSGSTSGLTSTNMQAALNEAYNNCKTKCPDGYKCTPLPKYFAFGTPTTSSATDYTKLGKNVFATLYSDGKTGGVCINDGGLFCIKTNDYYNSEAALKAHFGKANCSSYSSYVRCVSESFGCGASSDGTIGCNDEVAWTSCDVSPGGEVLCS